MSIKEVFHVPGRDGTGPMGAGPMTGRGLGVCAGGTANRGLGMGRGMGLGMGRGRGRGYAWRAPDARADDVSRKDFLVERKAELEWPAASQSVPR